MPVPRPHRGRQLAAVMALAATTSSARRCWLDDKPGWLHMFANADGRNYVDTLFPQACVEWEGLPFLGLPDDWRGMQVNLTECVPTMKTNLPLEVIPAGYTIDDCTPDQLAMLLAVGVTRAGGRAATIRKNNGEVRVLIFKSREN
jgi:hypothetical protein